MKRQPSVVAEWEAAAFARVAAAAFAWAVLTFAVAGLA
jgi:hypothetical protein